MHGKRDKNCGTRPPGPKHAPSTGGRPGPGRSSTAFGPWAVGGSRWQRKLAAPPPAEFLWELGAQGTQVPAETGPDGRPGLGGTESDAAALSAAFHAHEVSLRGAGSAGTSGGGGALSRTQRTCRPTPHFPTFGDTLPWRPLTALKIKLYK